MNVRVPTSCVGALLSPGALVVDGELSLRYPVNALLALMWALNFAPSSISYPRQQHLLQQIGLAIATEADVPEDVQVFLARILTGP